MPSPDEAGERVLISAAFQEWLCRRGVVAHGIQAAYVEEGWRGICAAQDIPAGALLLQVPERALMSTSSACRNQAFAKHLKQHSQSLSSEQVLIAHLLHEASQGSSSSWRPYTAQLPHEYTLIMGFSPEHIQALQFPHAMQLAAETCKQTLQQWKQARPLLQSLGLSKNWCSWRAWLWASSTVCSRTMHVPFSSAGALTPFGDLHNYHPPPPPHYPDIDGVSASMNQEAVQGSEDYGDGGYHEAFQEYCLYARKRYKKGEQVFLCYGKYTNLELLEHYGFVLPSNPHDKALLPLSAFPASFATYLQQQQHTIGQRWLHCNGIPGWELLRDLRCWASAPAERKLMRHLASAGQRISIGGDMKVFRTLQSVCETVLGQLPSTLKQDEALLQQSCADACMHAAISWRMSYKRCLQAGLQVANEAMYALADLSEAM